MKKKSEKIGHVGLRKKRECRYPGRAGELRIWDCSAGAPMPIGEHGERWAVEWVPATRKKGRACFIYVDTVRTAEACFRSLAVGKTDHWGLFEVVAPPDEGAELKPNGKQNDAGTPPGGGPLVLAADTPLTTALKGNFLTPQIVKLFEAQLEANRPIYATVDGNQEVVAYEPDWATRREALKLLLHYREGLPVKRVEEITRHETSNEEVLSRIATKPGYREAMRDYILFCDDQDQKRLANVMKAVPVAEVVPVEK